MLKRDAGRKRDGKMEGGGWIEGWAGNPNQKMNLNMRGGSGCWMPEAELGGPVSFSHVSDLLLFLRIVDVQAFSPVLTSEFFWVLLKNNILLYFKKSNLFIISKNNMCCKNSHRIKAKHIKSLD